MCTITFHQCTIKQHSYEWQTNYRALPHLLNTLLFHHSTMVYQQKRSDVANWHCKRSEPRIGVRAPVVQPSAVQASGPAIQASVLCSTCVRPLQYRQQALKVQAPGLCSTCARSLQYRCQAPEIQAPDLPLQVPAQNKCSYMVGTEGHISAHFLNCARLQPLRTIPHS